MLTTRRPFLPHVLPNDWVGPHIELNLTNDLYKLNSRSFYVCKSLYNLPVSNRFITVKIKPNLIVLQS